MARPPGKTFPISVMVKTTDAMKARLEALAARVPFDVSVGFSVVARRAIAIGLEVLERDPRLIVEPPEGDAVAARVVLSRPGLLERVIARADELRAEGDDVTEAAVSAALDVLGGGRDALPGVPAPQAPAQRAEAPEATKARPVAAKRARKAPGSKGEP